MPHPPPPKAWADRSWLTHSAPAPHPGHPPCAHPTQDHPRSSACPSCADRRRRRRHVRTAVPGGLRPTRRLQILRSSRRGGRGGLRRKTPRGPWAPNDRSRWPCSRMLVLLRLHTARDPLCLPARRRLWFLPLRRDVESVCSIVVSTMRWRIRFFCIKFVFTVSHYAHEAQFLSLSGNSHGHADLCGAGSMEGGWSMFRP